MGLPRVRRAPATAVLASVAAVIAPLALGAPAQAGVAASTFTRAVPGLGLEQWSTQTLVPGVSVNGSEGFTLVEEAEFMRSIGAVDALNLDGGGSTEMAVNGQLVNDPSGGSVRAVGDTVQVLP